MKSTRKYINGQTSDILSTWKYVYALYILFKIREEGGEGRKEEGGGVGFIIFIGHNLFCGIIIAAHESRTLDPSSVLVLFLIYGLGYIWRVNKCLHINRCRGR